MRTNHTLLLFPALLAATALSAQSNLLAPRQGRTAHPAAAHAQTLRGGSAPANDECSAAQTIAVVPVADCATSATAGSNANSVTSTGDPDCDGSSSGYQDVWYTFNSGTYSSLSIDLQNISMEDWSFTVQTSCDPGGEVACVVLPFEPLAVGVTPGTTYYIRVYSNSDFGLGGDFTLCVSYSGTGQAPANDDCANAVNTDLVLDAPAEVLTGDNTGATEDGNTGLNMVWHRVTTTAPGDLRVDYCVPGSEFDNFLANLIVNCPNIVDGALTGTTDSCSVTFECLPAGSYLIPVLVQSDTPQGPYSIAVSSMACAPPPANDTCLGAIALTVGTTCTPVDGTTTGALPELGAIECNHNTSPVANDVWYSFTATSTSDSIIVMGMGSFDAVIEVFSGDCSNLVSLGCEDSTFPIGTAVSERMYIGDLVIGQTYYIRVYDYAHLAAGHNFSICVVDAQTSGIAAVNGQQFSLYPNPTTGNLFITGIRSKGEVLFEITDMAGRTVYSTRMQAGSNSSTVLPLKEAVKPGSYLLRATSASGTEVLPVVVQ